VSNGTLVICLPHNCTKIKAAMISCCDRQTPERWWVVC